MGSNTFASRGRDRYVLYGYAVRKSYYVAVFHASSSLAGQGLFCQRVETGKTSFGQYGYACCVKHGNSLHL